jgi:MoaA/NifB/PqqE/SkfB family radical SAM enzyme
MLSLAEDVSLKRLEEPCVYDRVADEVRWVTEPTFAVLERIAAGDRAGGEPAVLARCLAEGLVVNEPPWRRRRTAVAPPGSPSLRDLELYVTARCDLSCRHCAGGEPHADDLSVFSLRRLLEEFEAGGGMRLVLTGGEPLQYPYFWQLNELLPAYDVRTVLFTNGAGLTAEKAAALHVHEVRVSLDGLPWSHDALRGAGSFAAALSGLLAAREAGLAISIASLVTALNAEEFDELAGFVAELDPWRWIIAVPALAGRAADRPELLADEREAAAALELALPGENAAEAGGSPCGLHQAAVLPDGGVARCGIARIAAGTIDDGLQAVWKTMTHAAAPEARCGGCAAWRAAGAA